MDVQTSARPPGSAAENVLDETDPHAGDDADWQEGEFGAAVAIVHEPSFLRFWKGLLLGLLLSAVVWCLLAAAAFVLYKAVTRS